MRYEVISFDLQGTISDSSFSDAFWLELLPQLYSEYHQLSVEDSKKALKEQFRSFGIYDMRYYSFDYWLKALNVTAEWNDLLKRVNKTPVLFPEMRSLIIKLSKEHPLLLFSATTKQFIQHELGDLVPYFKWIISAVDDLQCAGKPPQAFNSIATSLKISPEKILHIGDDATMDVKNAKEAGWNSFHFDKTKPFNELCQLLDIS